MPKPTTRRTFIKFTTAAASTAALEFSHATPVGEKITLIIDADSALTASDPARWAAEEFRQALRVRGISSLDSTSTLLVIVSPITGPLAKKFGALPPIT